MRSYKLERKTEREAKKREREKNKEKLFITSETTNYKRNDGKEKS